MASMQRILEKAKSPLSCLTAQLRQSFEKNPWIHLESATAHRQRPMQGVTEASRPGGGTLHSVGGGPRNLVPGACPSSVT